MAKVQLEIPADTELGEFLDMCEEYDLEFKIIEPRGQLNGDPLIEFIGADSAVRRFIDETKYDEEDDY